MALARRPDIAAFAHTLVAASGARGRVARLTALFTFVSHLVDTPPGDSGGRDPDGIDLLMALAGRREGPAILLAGLLRAMGERVMLQEAGGVTFVNVELAESDWAQLPPHAAPVRRHGRDLLPLDPRDARRPFGFLPHPVREATIERRSS